MPNSSRSTAPQRELPHEYKPWLARLPLWRCAPLRLPGRARRNVILVISDGVRWQEVFTEADPSLLNGDAGGSWASAAELKARYWDDDPTVRRKRLFPFLWETVATAGPDLRQPETGQRGTGHEHHDVLLPGLQRDGERSGRPAHQFERVRPEPERNGVRVAQHEAGLRRQGRDLRHVGRHRPDIFNGARSLLPIRSGATLVDANDRSPSGVLLNELYRTTTRLEGTDPFDSFLHVVVRDHLRAHRPRVLFIGYGDTDTWQHIGRYDSFLETAHSFDAYVAELWKQLQSTPDTRIRRH